MNTTEFFYDIANAMGGVSDENAEVIRGVITKHTKDYIHKSEAEYLCEISSLVWSKNGWIDPKKLPKEGIVEMLYEDWFCFYKYIYDVCNASDEKTSLLEIIYRDIDGGLMDMFADFLSTYKK